ncbi:Protein KINKY POLLEN [Hibiscus syriacus]|uniref:Protein KINKY POLLEN n=1 Tax=Hibiscus syriacus TaxID=106335 RepID=A0A6A2YZ08_HIBSY|nr:Protein KINKY POLLEN [Hibiscus syriacus]
MLSISAKVGDGVDALVQVQSIFSENAHIGVLLEGLMLSFNGARIFRSSQIQISRIPTTSDSSDAKVPVVILWDWVVQALDVHICMPFRLELRVIDDAFEEMLRALKLITKAKTELIFPMKTENLKPEKYNSTIAREGFQAGFKPSTARTSLLSVSATEFDVTLTRIDGGDDGMIELLKQLDFVCCESNIPFSLVFGRCEGRVVLAQQATCFQPQIFHDVFIGRWRKVCMLRSASGTTPPMKTYTDLPIRFKKVEVSFGVGYESVFADISYAFSVALRKANLSNRSPGLQQPPKKERSLPWWDEMRNYIHGNITLFFSGTKWNILATIDPCEKLDKLQIVSGSMEIQQSDGRVYVSAKDFKIFLSSLESLVNSRSLKLPTIASGAFLEAPVFSLEVTMDWECESGNPMNHYLFALPMEGKPREKVFDPFRSTSLSLRWNFSLKPLLPPLDKESPSASASDCTILDGTVNGAQCKAKKVSITLPTFNVGAHDLAWIIKFWNMNYIPPHKLRSFSRWPRFGVPRVPRSGNLPLDRRDPLDLVYQGLDLHMPKVFLNKEDCTSVKKAVQMMRKSSQSVSMEQVPSEKSNYMSACTEKHRDEGFLLSSDYFTIRRQAPKADPASENDEHARSDPGDDDGYNEVIADNCQRIFVYGLKLLWTIENRDVVWSFVGGISKVFEPQKPSPSRQYAQRKLVEEKQKLGEPEMPQEDPSKSPTANHGVPCASQNMEPSGSYSSQTHAVVLENSSTTAAALAKYEKVNDSGEKETRHFMVNVIEPQFNLHSEEANGRFLLVVVSGRVLAQSFHSVLHVVSELIEQALGTGNVHIPEGGHDMTLKRMEFVMMLEHVQAHVAPTDVDPGAGLQWLPKIRKSSPKLKRTGALLERVFMPCDMYFRYIRHKGGTSDLKVCNILEDLCKAVEKMNNVRVNGKIIYVSVAKYDKLSERKSREGFRAGGSKRVETGELKGRRMTSPAQVAEKMERMNRFLDGRTYRDTVVGVKKVPEGLQGFNVKVIRWGFAKNACLVVFQSVEERRIAMEERWEALSFWFQLLEPVVEERGIPLAYCAISMLTDMEEEVAEDPWEKSSSEWSNEEVQNGQEEQVGEELSESQNRVDECVRSSQPGIHTNTERGLNLNIGMENTFDLCKDVTEGGNVSIQQEKSEEVNEGRENGKSLGDPSSEHEKVDCGSGFLRGPVVQYHTSLQEGSVSVSAQKNSGKTVSGSRVGRGKCKRVYSRSRKEGSRSRIGTSSEHAYNNVKVDGAEALECWSGYSWILMTSWNLMSWNIRGLGRRVKARAVRRVVEERKPLVLFIQESKMEVVNQSVVRKMGGNLLTAAAVSAAEGSAGGLITLWNEKECQVQEEIIHRRFIAVKGTIDEVLGSCWFINVYGPSVDSEKEAFFGELFLFLENLDSPVCLGGDFNVVMSQEEKIGGSVNLASMFAFREFVSKTNLVDL